MSMSLFEPRLIEPLSECLVTGVDFWELKRRKDEEAIMSLSFGSSVEMESYLNEIEMNLRSKKSLRKLWSPWEDMKEGNVALFIELDEPPKSFGKIDSFNKIILLLENAS